VEKHGLQCTVDHYTFVETVFLFSNTNRKSSEESPCGLRCFQRGEPTGGDVEHAVLVPTFGQHEAVLSEHARVEFLNKRMFFISCHIWQGRGYGKVQASQAQLLALNRTLKTLRRN